MTAPHMDAGADRLQDRIARVERDLQRLEARLDRLAGDLDRISAAMATAWATVEQRLAEKFPTVTGIDRTPTRGRPTAQPKGIPA